MYRQRNECRLERALSLTLQISYEELMRVNNRRQVLLGVNLLRELASTALGTG